MSNDIYFLSSSNYLPQKRQIVIEFSCGQKKFSKRYSFFPFFFLPKKPVFEDVANQLDLRRFKVDEFDEKTLQVVAATFEELQEAAAFVQKESKKEVLVLDAERQFLIEKNWSYFDSFLIDKDEPLKQEQMSAPEAFVDFLSSSIDRVFFDIKKSDENFADIFLQKVCFSNILGVKIPDLPDDFFAMQELFLEKISFKNHFPVVFEKTGVQNISQNNFSINGREFVEINFLGTLSSVLSLYNFGFDSLNCSCCADSKSVSNISPTSLVEVEFLSDGVYFESCFDQWAVEFHNSQPNKSNRIAFGKEWFFQKTPVGPFFSDEPAIIPFCDYRFLEKKGLVKRDFSFKEKKWFCEKKQSFFSAELKENQKQSLSAMNAAGKLEGEKIVSSGVLFSKTLSQNFSYYYFNAFFECLRKLSFAPILLVCEQKSSFFDKALCGIVESTKEGILREFKEFAEQNGSAKTKISGYSAFVKSKNPFFIAKNFAKSNGFLEPELLF